MPGQAGNSSLVGVRGAGKSTIGGLLTLTAQDMADRRSGLRIEIRELTLDLRTIVDDMIAGSYPPPTKSAESFVAELRLSFRRTFPVPGTSEVAFALADVAGESLREVMDRFSKQDFALDEATLARIRDVNQFVLNATSFMLVIDLERMLLSKETVRDRQDAQLARFADSLLKYKDHNRKSPPIRAVAIILAKYDRVEDLLSVRDSMSLRETQGRSAFVSKYMLQTRTALKNLPPGSVEMFYSFCQPELDAGGQPTGRIRLDKNSNRPVYSADEYERLVEWIHQKIA